MLSNKTTCRKYTMSQMIILCIVVIILLVARTALSRGQNSDYKYVNDVFEYMFLQDSVNTSISVIAVEMNDERIIITPNISTEDHVMKGLRIKYHNIITKAFISYSYDDSNIYKTEKLTYRENNAWTANIPVLKNTEGIKFFITSVDSMNNIHTEMPDKLSQNDIINSEKLIDIDNRKHNFMPKELHAYGVASNSNSNIQFYINDDDIMYNDLNLNDTSISITNYDVIDDYNPYYGYRAAIYTTKDCPEVGEWTVNAKLNADSIMMKTPRGEMEMKDENNSMGINVQCERNRLIFDIDRSKFTPQFVKRKMSVVFLQGGTNKASGVITVKFVYHKCENSMNKLQCTEVDNY